MMMDFGLVCQSMEKYVIDRQTDRQTDCFIVINTLHVHSQN